MTYEAIWNILQILGVLMVAVTFTIGALVFFTGYKAREERDRKAQEQRERIAELTRETEALKNNTIQLEKEVAEAKTKQADAESRLLGLQKKVSWRFLDESKFIEVLIDKAKGTVEIVFLKDDNEAYLLANKIWSGLNAVGWTVSQPIGKSNSKDVESNIPFSMAEGGIVISNEPTLIIAVEDETVAKPYDADTPLAALMKAFETTGFKPLQIIPHEEIRPPKGVIRIIVGSRL